MLGVWMYFWSTAAWVQSTGVVTTSYWLTNTYKIVPPLVSLR